MLKGTYVKQRKTTPVQQNKAGHPGFSKKKWCALEVKGFL